MQVAPSVIHYDDVSLLTASGVIANVTPVPVVCTPPDTPYVVRFVWRAAEGQTVAELDQAAIVTGLQTVAERVDGLFWRDSDAWHEVRTPRWATTVDCRLDVIFLEYGANFDFSPDTYEKRIFVEWSEPRPYCGYALLAVDTRPGVDNANNASTFIWIAQHCVTPYVVAHELLHSFWAVQEAAPHFVKGWHATDAGDIMSSAAPGTCATWDVIDCGKDDYFSLAPAPGAYLAEHWNSANSLYLVRTARHVRFLPLAFYNASEGWPYEAE